LIWQLDKAHELNKSSRITTSKIHIA